MSPANHRSRANRLLAALDPADYRELAPHLRMEALPRGTVLFNTPARRSSASDTAARMN
jgi:hypothetical protein